MKSRNFIETGHSEFIRDFSRQAVELAESEYRERAIEAFCSFNCPNEEDIIGCIKDKVCASLELFIAALDNPKTE